MNHPNAPMPPPPGGHVPANPQHPAPVQPGAAAPTSPAGAAPAAKKPLHPLAWVAIGCGGLLVAGGIALTVLFAFGAHWLSGKAKAFQENPAMASAKMVVRMSPEVDLVESDDAAGTLTVRNKKSGEVVTVGLAEVQQGRIQFKSGSGEEVSLRVDPGDEPGGGILTVEGNEGRMRIGAGGKGDIPPWVPRYAGAPAEGSFFSASGGKTAGGFTFRTQDAPEAVAAWFEKAAKGAGLEPAARQSFRSGAGGVENLSARGGGRMLNLVVSSKDGETRGMLSFSETER